jgi:hypothetical protein
VDRARFCVVASTDVISSSMVPRYRGLRRQLLLRHALGGSPMGGALTEPFGRESRTRSALRSNLFRERIELRLEPFHRSPAA